MTHRCCLHALVVTWSAIETGSTSTTDDNGQPTIIPAPFYICNDPLCANTGCILAILCSSGGGSIDFGGFPSPEPPNEAPEDNGGDNPSDSASQSKSTPTSVSSQSSESSSVTTASSSSSTSSSSRTCGDAITTVIDPGPTSAGDPDDGSRRLIRGMLKSKDFIAAKRVQPSAIKRIGDCNLAKEVKIPLFLRFGKAMDLQNQMNGQGGAFGRIYNANEKWYPEHVTSNGDPFEGAKDSNNFGAGVEGSIDHVWEKSNVVNFLTSVLRDDLDCDDLNALFFACKNNILQTIFNQLPSMDSRNLQTGFATMNGNLNGMKGWMFKRKFEGDIFDKVYKTPSDIIQGLQRQAIIFDLFRSDAGIQKMHDQTNNRIYGAFLALDKHISDNKIQRAKDRGDLTQTFGPTFRAWYENLLDDVGEATYKWANDQVTIINTKLNRNPDSDCDLRKAAIAFQASPLYGETKFELDQSHLKWSASEVLIGRSLFGRAGTCTALNIISSSASSSSTQASASQTMSSTIITFISPTVSLSSTQVSAPEVISHTLTTSASPTPSTPPPITINGPHCAAVSNNPTGGKYCGFKDIHTKDVDAEAKWFEIGEPSDMTPDSQNHTEVWKGNAKVALIMNVGWIPGCTVYGSQSSLNPLGHAGDDTISYRTLLKDAYRNCRSMSYLPAEWKLT